MQIDWTIVSYVVVGIFALIGFFRGWWKEALATFFLTLLVLLLRQPDLARTVVEWLNQGAAVVSSFLANLFGFSVDSGTVFQLEPNRSSTWLIILFFVLGFSALLAWIFLPSSASKAPAKYYTLTVIGRVLGLLVGAVNGFLFINLVREYLDGRSLPGNTSLGEASATSLSNAAIAAPASTFSVQVVNLPDFTILDSYIPWLIIGSGILVLVAVLAARVAIQFKPWAVKVNYADPFGYKPLKTEKPKKPDPQEVKVVT